MEKIEQLARSLAIEARNLDLDIIVCLGAYERQEESRFMGSLSGSKNCLFLVVSILEAVIQRAKEEGSFGTAEDLIKALDQLPFTKITKQ